LKRFRLLAALVSLGVASGCSYGHLAPQAPEKPWQPEEKKKEEPSKKFDLPSDSALPYQRDETQLVEDGHTYDLAGLIDLAERSNQDTRIAWEQARQAAFAVGLSEAAYLPSISAELVGGFQHVPLPIPPTLASQGYFITNTSELLPTLSAKWLLFDFGKRSGTIETAKQLSFASNVAFTGVHQKLIFEVSKAYFNLDAVRAQLHVAEEALSTAKTLQDAAEAKKKTGLETVTEVARARRETAKAQYDVEEAKAADNDAYHALLEAMGLTPTLKLKIAESSGRALPKSVPEEMKVYIDRALESRPDILASLSKMRATEGEIRSARSSYFPTLGVEGFVNQNIGSLSIDGSPTYRVNKPAAAILFKLSLPLYDGGARESTLSIAHSKNEAAREELLKDEDEAVRQVARTYDSVKSSLAEYDSARALVTASDTAYSAALESYRHGVGTLTDAVTAETERAQARSAEAQAYAGVLTSAAALAFSTGELTSAEAIGKLPIAEPGSHE
jgi:outer membrane protein